MYSPDAWRFLDLSALQLLTLLYLGLIPSELAGDDLHFSLYFLHERRLVLRFVLGTLCVRRSARVGVRIRRFSLAMLRIQRRALCLCIRQRKVRQQDDTEDGEG